LGRRKITGQRTKEELKDDLLICIGSTGKGHAWLLRRRRKGRNAIRL